MSKKKYRNRGKGSGVAQPVGRRDDGVVRQVVPETPAHTETLAAGENEPGPRYGPANPEHGEPEVLGGSHAPNTPRMPSQGKRIEELRQQGTHHEEPSPDHLSVRTIYATMADQTSQTVENDEMQTILNRCVRYLDVVVGNTLDVLATVSKADMRAMVAGEVPVPDEIKHKEVYEEAAAKRADHRNEPRGRKPLLIVMINAANQAVKLIQKIGAILQPEMFAQPKATQAEMVAAVKSTERLNATLAGYR